MSDMVQGLVQKLTEKAVGRGKVHNVCVNCNDTGKDEWFGAGFKKPDIYEGDEIEFEVEENDRGYLQIVEGSIKIISEGGGEDAQPQRGRGGRGNGGSRGSRGGDSGRGSSGRSSNSGRGGRSSGSSERGGSRSGGRGSAGTTSQRGGRGGSTGRGRAGNSSSGGMSKEQYWDNKAADDKLKDKRITQMACFNSAIAFVELAVKTEAVKLPSKQADKLDALTALVDEEQERLYERLMGEAVEDKSDAVSHDEGSHDYDDDGDIPE